MSDQSSDEESEDKRKRAKNTSQKKKKRKLGKPKTSTKAHGPICAFAANSLIGLIEKSNDERVSVVLNMKAKSPNQEGTSESHQKKEKQNGETNVNSKSSNFHLLSIFDGHGGNACSDFLAENFHNFVFFL